MSSAITGDARKRINAKRKKGIPVLDGVFIEAGPASLRCREKRMSGGDTIATPEQSRA
jgi:hypothetical protein